MIDYFVANQDKLIPSHGPGFFHDPDMVRTNKDPSIRTPQFVMFHAIIIIGLPTQNSKFTFSYS
jgi:hypothetical protein